VCSDINHWLHFGKFLKGTQNLTSVVGFPKFSESSIKFSNKSLTFKFRPSLYKVAVLVLLWMTNLPFIFIQTLVEIDRNSDLFLIRKKICIDIWISMLKGYIDK